MRLEDRRVVLAAVLVSVLAGAGEIEAQMTDIQVVEPAACEYKFQNLQRPRDLMWEDYTIDELMVSHEPCDSPSLENFGAPFAARISQRIPRVEIEANGGVWEWGDAETDAPTVLFIKGGSIQTFISATSDGAGYTSLQDQLWAKGARILEVAFKCPVGPISLYADSEGCQYNRLNNVLEILKDREIVVQPGGAPTGEMWWPPANEHNRFAIGESAGQIQLQYAIEKLDDDWAVMNRVVYGGGGVFYALHDRIDCNDPEGVGDVIGCDGPAGYSCDALNALDLLFEASGPDVVQDCGGCWNTGNLEDEDEGTCEDFDEVKRLENCQPTNPMDCSNTSLQVALDLSSTDTYIGDPVDDASRIVGNVLQNTGYDFGINQEANREFMDLRQGTPKATWNLADCVCDCAFYGHGLVDRMFALFQLPTSGAGSGNPASVEDWVEFFLTGDTDFNFFTDVPVGPEEIEYFSLENPPNESQCLAKFGVGVVQCAASRGSLPDGYLPVACSVP